MPTWAKILSLLTTKIKTKKYCYFFPKWKFIKELSYFIYHSVFKLRTVSSPEQILKKQRKIKTALLQQIHSQSSSIAPVGFNT